MGKPKNPTLRRVTDLLDERNVRYEVHPKEPYFFGSPETVYVATQFGTTTLNMPLGGRNVHMDAIVPPEGAVMTICGPDKRLEDKYPTLIRHMSFANVSMGLETDRRDVLMPVEKVDVLKEHMDRLGNKVKNQKKDLRRLHLKCMRQQDEITRMEDNALHMMVMNEGYAEGE